MTQDNSSEPFDNAPFRAILDSDDSDEVKACKISWLVFNYPGIDSAKRTKKIRNKIGPEILDLIHCGVSREEITREFLSVLDKLENEDHADCYRNASNKDCSRGNPA